jgi:hypothetical protein
MYDTVYVCIVFIVVWPANMRNRINKRPEIIGRSLSNLYKKVNNFHPTRSGLLE